MKYFKILITPPPFSLEHGHCPAAEPRSKESSFLSVLKCALACFALVFFVLAGNAHAQQTPNCPHTPPDTPTDKDALIALYCATDGDNWTSSDNWLTNKPLYEWEGVNVDATDNDRVDRLQLPNKNLSGPLPTELGNLTSVTSLALNNNNITGEIPDLSRLTRLRQLLLKDNMLSAIPSSLGNLTDLREINLARNMLTGEIPEQLGKLSNLEQLYLNNNMLSGEIPTELGDLSSLQYLVLWDNNLSGEIPDQLGNLARLKSLGLWGNDLTGKIPSSLGDLSNLQSLDLVGNKLTGEIPEQLGDLTSLQYLYLWGNDLTGSIPTELGDLSNLEQLYLHKNKLTGEIPEQLGKLTSLQYLYLWGNDLTEAIPTELGDLTNLQQLYLSQNQLTGTIPTELGNLAQLQELYLNGNELTGSIPTELGNLAQLRELHLRDNELTGSIPTELGNLSDLQQLYLNNNRLTGSTPATELGNLTDLEELGLWGNEELTWDTISSELGRSADRAVLRTLYDVNGGKEWSNEENQNDNWFSSVEISSSWYGVSTDMDTGRVSGLNLRNNGLKEELTNAIEALDGLKDLNISNNRQLRGELPLRLRDILPLETLDIRCTDVSTPTDAGFQMWLSGITFREACPPPPVQPLEQVMGIRVIEGVEQLSVSWNPVSEADGYKVQWKSGSQQFDSSRQHIVTSGDTTSYTISNLVSGTEYTVRVIATKSDADDGTPSLEVTRATSPSAPEPPVQSPGSPQSSGGGGCAIASNAEARDNSQKVVFDLLLIISALIAVSWKSSSGTRRTQHSGLRNPSKISCEQEITPGVSLNSPARGRGKVFSSAFCRNEASRQFTTTQAGCGAGKQLVSQKET